MPACAEHGRQAQNDPVPILAEWLLPIFNPPAKMDAGCAGLPLQYNNYQTVFCGIL